MITDNRIFSRNFAVHGPYLIVYGRIRAVFFDQGQQSKLKTIFLQFFKKQSYRDHVRHKLL
jgi:hypothetical protein